MTTEIDTPNSTEVELSPSYKIPLFLIVAAIPLSFIWIWGGGAIALLGIFLTVQTKIIRLRFTTTALDVYRSQTRIRSFPYKEWSNWRIFWQSVPILFYFREVNSIHFLPIIFDPIALTNCLNQHCPQVKE
jgi:hypothetical protein